MAGCCSLCHQRRAWGVAAAGRSGVVSQHPAPATARRQSARGADPASGRRSSVVHGPRRARGAWYSVRPGCVRGLRRRHCFFCPSRVLMSAHDRPIDEVNFPVQRALLVAHSLQLRQHLVPDAGLAPALEAAVNRRPAAIPFRQIAPRRTRAQDPENAVDDRAMVAVRPSGPRLLRRKQWFQPLPLFVRQVMSVHGALF
jgi:hypothetical protein